MERQARDEEFYKSASNTTLNRTRKDSAPLSSDVGQTPTENTGGCGNQKYGGKSD